MTNLTVHPAGDRFVIDSDDASFKAMVSVVLGVLNPHEKRADAPAWLAELRTVIGRVAAWLPPSPSYPNWDAYFEAHEIPGVDFVSVSAHVVVSLERQVLQGIADCLEGVVVKGDSRDFSTLAGAHFVEIRQLYLKISGALGNERHARAIAFPRTEPG